MTTEIHMPLRISLESTMHTIDVGDFPRASIPTQRRITATFSTIHRGTLTEYTFEALGPVTVEQRTGELSEDDVRMLRATRRLITNLLQEEGHE